jgi:hypothetical protein
MNSTKLNPSWRFNKINSVLSAFLIILNSLKQKFSTYLLLSDGYQKTLRFFKRRGPQELE